MPQISLPDKLSEIGERIHDAAEEAHLPDEVRERIDEAADLLADAGKQLSEAGNRLGSEVADRLGDARWPALALPAALRAMTNVRAPKMEVRKVDLPRLDARDLRRAVGKLDLPQVTIGKPKPSGPPVVPLVILAAVGGAFVGWWLATSSYTSARVQSVVQQVRARLGLGTDWDENVEERTEDFWGDERGWETNQRPGGAALGGDEMGQGEQSSLDGGASVDGWGDSAGSDAPGAAGDGVPSGSIGGDGATDDSGASDAGNAPWGGGSSGGSDTGGMNGDPSTPTGSTWAEGSSEESIGSTGGVGYDPDAGR